MTDFFFFFFFFSLLGSHAPLPLLALSDTDSSARKASVAEEFTDSKVEGTERMASFLSNA